MRVTQHNLKRQLHENTNDVAYDLDIACQAKTWADHMANNDSFAHAPADQRPGQGENLAMTWSTGTLPTVYTPETGWYDDEIPFYDWVTGESTDPGE